MDKPLEQQELSRVSRNKRLKAVALVLVLITAFFSLRAALVPGIDRDDIRLSIVERGDVRATISASGVVTPRNELVISSSFTSEVKEILAVAGANVNEGDPILLLDSKPLQVVIQDLQEKLALKENERLSAGLKLEQSTNDAEGRYELRKIDLESRQAKHQRLSTLAKSGVISKGELEEAQLDVRRTTVEIEQLEKQMINQQQSNRAELDRITLEAGILQNQLDEKKRLMDMTIVKAPRAGVLTWVLDEIGTSISTGEPLARIADLSAYRVEATMSDFYAPQLQEGLAVTVVTASTELEGIVQSVLPTVENGAMKLMIALDNPAAAGLRPQLRVNVDIVTGFAGDTLRFRKGLGITGGGRQQLYRVTDDMAYRSDVQLGLGNREYIEVLSGLKEGDEIIVSDNSEFKHLEELEIE
jgi:HlyD family secretion protein